MAQLPSIRKMAKIDLREATEALHDEMYMRVLTRLKYSKFGAFSRSIEERLKVYLQGTKKNERPLMTERLLKKYNALDFTLNGVTFYANMEALDELLYLIKSYYEQD